MTCPHPDDCGPVCSWRELGVTDADHPLTINEPCPVCGQRDGGHDLGRHVAAGALLTTYPEEP